MFSSPSPREAIVSCDTENGQEDRLEDEADGGGDADADAVAQPAGHGGKHYTRDGEIRECDTDEGGAPAEDLLGVQGERGAEANVDGDAGDLGE